MKTWVKIFDILIIVFVAVLTFFAAYMTYLKPQKNLQVLIRGQDREWTFPAGAEETIIVTGPIGETKIRLHEKRAWVEASPCGNQNCVAAGFISRAGQWTACLPNNVLLVINGTEDNDVDSIAW